MAYTKKVLKTIAYVILVLLVSLCLYTFIMTDILKKDYANVFGYTYFVVSTGSMSGTIEVNDIVFVKVTDDVKLNDIVTFKNKDGQVITHRLIQKVGEKLITKGDVNNIQDDPITKKDVIGKVNLIVSPSFILKTIAISLIVFIFLALINFDKIFKKYVIGDSKGKKKDKKEIVENHSEETPKIEEKFIAIPLGELERSNKNPKTEEVEVLDIENDETVESLSKQEKDLLDQIVNLLKMKNDSLTTSKITKSWLTKYQYLYKLAHIIQVNDIKELEEEIKHPSFKERYDYDLEKVGLYQSVRNRIYDVPIYVALRILLLAILYNDEEFFDGVFKIMKYKIQIDKNGYFTQLKDQNDRKELSNLIIDMQKIGNKFDEENILELDRIEKLVKLKNYINK